MAIDRTKTYQLMDEIEKLLDEIKEQALRGSKNAIWGNADLAFAKLRNLPETLKMEDDKFLEISVPLSSEH